MAQRKTWKEEGRARMESRQESERTELPKQGQGSASGTRRTRKDENNDKEKQDKPESTDVLGAEEDLEGGREGEDGK